MLEEESIYILREVVAQFTRPCLLYSAGKDSSVLLHLAKKAFSPYSIPFPVLHIDTSFKFPEMYEFRDRKCREHRVELLVRRNDEALINADMNPDDYGMSFCCKKLKTEALIDALKYYEMDAAIGGARREEERSRSKERIFSWRDKHGAWHPEFQRPEYWSIYNGRIKDGEHMRVFPLSNWTEIDIWRYIKKENIEVVPLYFAHKRGGELVRYRTLGCMQCTGSIQSKATTVDEIIEELLSTEYSERAGRMIDHDQDGSMEIKKIEGYF